MSEPEGLQSAPQASGEQRTSDEGRRRPKAPRKRAGDST